MNRRLSNKTILYLLLSSSIALVFLASSGSLFAPAVEADILLENPPLPNYDPNELWDHYLHDLRVESFTSYGLDDSGKVVKMSFLSMYDYNNYIVWMVAKPFAEGADTDPVLKDMNNIANYYNNIYPDACMKVITYGENNYNLDIWLWPSGETCETTDSDNPEHIIYLENVRTASSG
ncbi:MAG: hypothetical protein KKF44_01460 [Nanoarchaeota archaeon]|nr:hypothetical protein [Nanoarchaeota archaeon]